MTDRRSLLANDRVAASELEGSIAAPAYVEGEWRRVVVPVADLLAAPEGARDRQLLYGQRMRVLEVREGWAFGAAARDGYVGYVAAGSLGDDVAATHRVAVPATHLYPVPDLRRRERAWLSFGSELRVVSASGEFFETAEGLFVPKPHLRPLNAQFADPVTVAQLFFGVPYLWGGNSAAGIDCSGLVQAACLAAGIDCPGDTDLQEAALGETLAPGVPPARGDVYFWNGHVALAVDGETLIHANARTMAVTYEPIAGAIARIEAQGEGPVTRRARLAAG
ncbi:NLP/P60 hydrolase [Rhodovulum sp. 12E13]|uniref:C40 family peptidase n=1 Tax=Rhodovulum sp. 12E13 TaxID=2203891 RepID=UPI000E1452F5|nr:NlpC/P60 family protein [Rhodovulum sp. 12E13]RDC71551.1 NLP/P60 hydrolase [Rhodovulum sp. 12E13]